MDKFKQVGKLFYRIDKNGHIGVYTRTEIKFLIWLYELEKFLKINKIELKK